VIPCGGGSWALPHRGSEWWARAGIGDLPHQILRALPVAGRLCRVERTVREIVGVSLFVMPMNVQSAVIDHESRVSRDPKATLS